MAQPTSVLRTRKSKLQIQAAYHAILEKWPVPYEELTIPTRFGDTSILACGPREAPPVMLLHSGDTHEPAWIRNVTALSKSYRVYALDVIGELNRRIHIRPIRSHRKLMDWLIDLFDGLNIEIADLIGSSNGWFFALETAIYLPKQTRKTPALENFSLAV
jgi:pimeloyl-ACP methyl ester carboxylesterase